MSLQNLTKKIKREVKASPQKAAALSVLLLVALYFWAPLVMKWFGDSEGDAVASATSATNTNPTNATATETMTPAAAKPKTPPPNWRQMAAAIERDPRMTPAEPIVGRRDPLQPSRMLVKATTAPPVAEAKPPAKAISPDACGLKLASTILGSKLKIAWINGKSYAVDARIACEDHGDVVFRLDEIKARSVILERLGERYELKMEASETSDAGPARLALGDGSGPTTPPVAPKVAAPVSKSKQKSK